MSVRPKPSLRACGARPSTGTSPARMALPRKARDAREVFPEGRALRVRKSGPDASPDISFPPHASKMTRRPSGNMCRLGPSHPCGRAEPAPPRGQAQHGWPYGGRPGDDARDGFPGGMHSVRPRGAAPRMARHCVATGAFSIRRWPKRGQCWG